MTRDYLFNYTSEMENDIRNKKNLSWQIYVEQGKNTYSAPL